MNLYGNTKMKLASRNFTMCHEAEKERDLAEEECNMLRNAYNDIRVLNIKILETSTRIIDKLRIENEALQAELVETRVALAPLDAVVHELGIEDSDMMPVEAVLKLKAEITTIYNLIRRLNCRDI